MDPYNEHRIIYNDEINEFITHLMNLSIKKHLFSEKPSVKCLDLRH